MKRLLFLLAVFVCAAGKPAGATEYPWCSNFADGAGANCGFLTYEQCILTARGTGGYCAENTFYTAPATAVRPRHPARNRHSPK